MIVIIPPNIAPCLLFAIKAWCEKVIEAPDDNNKIVFSKGTAKAFKGVIPVGGQWPPNSMAGLKAEWKKAQKQG